MTIIAQESTVRKQSKIKNLFPRKGENTNKIIVNGEYTDRVFETIALWDVTEKIDGMNIRVHADQNGDFLVGGKTDRAQIPGDLYNWIVANLGYTYERDTPGPQHILEITEEYGHGGYSVTLFGEGYGPGIQGGDYYRDDKAFILYDVLFTKDDGRQFFVSQKEVQEIGKLLSIPTVNCLTDVSMEFIFLFMENWVMALSDGLDGIKNDAWMFKNGKGDPYFPEGIVAYPSIPLYNSFGERICFKLKTKDIANSIKIDENGVETPLYPKFMG